MSELMLLLDTDENAAFSGCCICATEILLISGAQAQSMSRCIMLVCLCIRIRTYQSDLFH